LEYAVNTLALLQTEIFIKIKTLEKTAIAGGFSLESVTWIQARIFCL
jgi:hypothetical protein